MPRPARGTPRHRPSAGGHSSRRSRSTGTRNPPRRTGRCRAARAREPAAASSPVAAAASSATARSRRPTPPVPRSPPAARHDIVAALGRPASWESLRRSRMLPIGWPSMSGSACTATPCRTASWRGAASVPGRASSAWPLAMCACQKAAPAVVPPGTDSPMLGSDWASARARTPFSSSQRSVWSRCWADTSPAGRSALRVDGRVAGRRPRGVRAPERQRGRLPRADRARRGRLAAAAAVTCRSGEVLRPTLGNPGDRSPVPGAGGLPGTGDVGHCRPGNDHPRHLPERRARPGQSLADRPGRAARRLAIGNLRRRVRDRLESPDQQVNRRAGEPRNRRPQ